MTPAQKVGLIVGDKIRILEKEHDLPFNSIAVLAVDDGSKNPSFKSEDGSYWYFTLTQEWEKVEDKK